MGTDSKSFYCYQEVFRLISFCCPTRGECEKARSVQGGTHSRWLHPGYVLMCLETIGS